ncbi:MAG: [protein-PII] uridylyltransferase [Acidobacteria bacterium]|nr:[protein-PII] uridylyltransferase [Acidobacteriota bacterium]
MDQAVESAFREYLAPGFSSSLAVAAVGGFGRRELFPHSDVDVLVLLEKEALVGASKDAMAGFLRALWDQRLRVSQSVRTLDECCALHEGNIELTVSLLDLRFLAGDRSLYDALAERLPRFLHSQRQSLVRHLSKLSRARHGKYQNTIYHLEPNLKETPGGLRDLHLLGWLGKLRTMPPEALDESRRFLHAARCFLHLQSGRDNNLLSFDAQEEIAGEGGAAAWMREYFRHARSIHRAALRALEAGEGANSSMLAQFRDWRARVSNADFSVARERVLLKSPHGFEKDPELALRLFRFVARHGFRLAADTERRLAEHSGAVAAWFARGGQLWPALREILELPHAVQALREMHDTGILGALFPEWEQIDCLVVRDFYHRYTVDEHTLVTLQTLADLRGTADPERRRFAEMLEEIEHPAVLFFALLFHDTGKGFGQGRHIAESLRRAESAMERIHMPLADRETVRFLIARHLDLSAVMTSRDLDAPETARALADGVETVERLRCLALLTYADTSAVNPTAMSPWRLGQLWRACLAAYRELTRELDTDRIQLSGGPAERAEFLDGFPVRYLRTHSEAEIATHLDLDRRCRTTGVAADVERLSGVYRLAVATRDRKSLFAALAGVLSSFGMNILKAEAFGNRQGRVLDTFVFCDPSRTLDLNPPEVDRLRLAVERVALGKVDVAELLRGRPKPVPPSRQSRIRPRVSFDNDASSASTLVEIVAEDRPGLLYDLARTLSAAGCNIEVVLIDTEAHKALDVFYITRDGRKLEPGEHAALRAQLLSVC